jgi:hypothetical protein
MDYGKVLSRAWEITWRWKVLWILGFLASLGQGGFGGNSGYTTDRSDWVDRYGVKVPPEIVGEVIGVLVAIACVLLLFAVAVWLVSVIARGGLIAGVQQVEDEGSTSFLEAWRGGRSRFWTLFGISILTGLPILILVVMGIAAVVLLLFGTVGIFETSKAAGISGIIASVLCGGAFCCGTVILAIILDQIRVYAERAAVLEGLGWIDAFRRGWEVLRSNLGPTVLYWAIVFVLGLVFAGVVMGGLAVVIAPLVAVLSSVDPGLWMVAPICLGGLVGMVVFSLIRSALTTFTSATWTLAYREFVGLAGQASDEPATES